MSTVVVRPPVVDVLDILEYALALIEEHGWRQGPRVPENEDWDEVVKQGLSLHDSIGLACYRLSGETNGQSGRSNKDFPTSIGTSLRQEATAAVQAHIKGSHTDVTFNDAAGSVGAVTDVLKAAIKEEEARV
jgi:hypothetical protein